MSFSNSRISRAALVVFLALTASASPTETSKDLVSRADTSGCGNSHAPGFHDGLTIPSNNKTRSYAVYVPATNNNNPRLERKVIFDFHGASQTPLQQYNNSRYYAFAGGEEYLAVYPAGLSKAWQGANYSEPNVNDTLFTSDLLTHIRQNYCVNSSAIYASGKSNGGGFVDTLACSEVGDNFAAFAMASAALYTDNSENSCKKQRAILESHGDTDNVIKYTGGPENGGNTPDIITWVGWWGHRNKCTSADRKQVAEAGYNVTSYSCGGFTDVVKHYQVYDMGHCWPTNDGNNTDGTTSRCDRPANWALSYTPKVLDYFAAWTLGNAPKN